MLLSERSVKKTSFFVDGNTKQKKIPHSNFTAWRVLQGEQAAVSFPPDSYLDKTGWHFDWHRFLLKFRHPDTDKGTFRYFTAKIWHHICGDDVMEKNVWTQLPQGYR